MFVIYKAEFYMMLVLESQQDLKMVKGMTVSNQKEIN
jgi:hypothetical protein